MAEVKPMPKRAIEMSIEKAHELYPEELRANNRSCELDEECGRLNELLWEMVARKNDQENPQIIDLARQISDAEGENERLVAAHPWIVDRGFSGFLLDQGIILKRREL